LYKHASLIALALLAGCARDGEIDATGGIAITRTACPAVAVPANTGDITLFNPPASREARAIDVSATLTNVRMTCGDQGTDVVANAAFDVQAQRANASGARTVELPYFAVVVRGGNTVVAKRVQTVTLNFADGQLRASASGQGGAVINRAAATLPEDVRQKLARRRKADDADASIDPLSAPDVRGAVARASFELLVGFQLTDAQLQYNATR
jgi:predicted kinase